MRVERNRKTFRKQFARVTFRLLASTALALIVVAGARPAAAQDAGSFAPGAFVGGQQVIPQYECHESPGNFACGTVGGDTIIYDLTGSFTAQSSWDSVLDKGHFVRAPGPDDAAIIDGHHSGYFQPVMGPEMTGAHNTKISGYYTIGFNGTAGFSGDGFHVSNVSGTVKSLSLTGFGTAEIGTITATDVAFLGTNGGFPVAKILADGSIDYAAGFESQGLTITGGGMLKTHQLDISASTAKGYTGAIDIKDGTILYGDAVRILSAAPLGLAALPDPTTVSAPVTISGGAIKAGGTLSLLVSDAVNSPTVTVASSVILDSGGLYATGEAGHGDIIVGTTIDGNTANPGQRFIVKADGASNINSAGDTLIGLYAPATLEARGTTKIVTSGDAYIGVLEPASDSSVLLSGAGVKWNAAKRFLIGGNGAGNVLTLENGAALNVDDRLFLGVNSGGRGNVVLNSGSLITAHAQAGPGTIAVSIGDGADAFGDIAIKGKGSKLTAFGTLIVGRSGMGGLSVSDGGAVQVNDPIIRVGRNAGSEGTVRITGEGSELTSATGTLYAGFLGTGNVFVSDHGLLQVKAIELGSMTGAMGTLSLDGASDESKLGKVIVGNLGTGTLTVANGKVTVDALQVGAENGSHGFLILQDNAELKATTAVFGSSGSGSATIKGGAKLTLTDESAGPLYVGDLKGAEGHLTVSGNNSLLEAKSGLVIGGNGTGTVDISEGGEIDAGESIVIGARASGVGALTIDSSAGGSSISVNNITVGLAGMGTLELKGSGRSEKIVFGPNANAIVVGSKEGSNGTLKLSNLTLDLTGGATNRIIIGDQGNGTLEVGAGARVDADNTTVGLGATGEHHLLVTGQAAEYHVADTLRVGSGSGATGTVDLNNGGKLFVKTLNVGGAMSTPKDASVTVSSGAEIDGATGVGTDILVQANMGNANFYLNDGGIVQFNSIKVKSKGSSFSVNDESTLVRTGTSTPYGVDITDNAYFYLSGGKNIDLGPVRVAGGGNLVINGQRPYSLGDVLLADDPMNILQVNAHGTQVKFKKLDVQAGRVLFAEGEVTIDDLQTSQTSILPDLTINTGATVRIGGTGDVSLNLNTSIESAASLEIRGQSFNIPAGQAKVKLQGGASLTVFSASFVVSGTLEVTDGGKLFRVNQPVMLGTNGVLRASGAEVSLTGISRVTGGSNSLLQASNNANFEIGSTVNLGTGSTIDALTGTIRIGSGAFIPLLDPKTGKNFTDAVLNTPGYVVVKSGGFLSGIGQIKGSIVNAGGIVHAGNSPGTITVTGDYLQGPGGQLLLSVSNTDYSKLIVGGAATFSGGKIVIDVAPGTILTGGTQYRFVSASGAVTGQVDQVVAPTAFADFQTSFAGGALSLVVVHRAGSYAAAAVTANQRAVGQAFDGLGQPASPAAAQVSDGLLNQAPAALPATLDQLSGEVHASGIAALVEDTAFSRDAILDRLAEPGQPGIWARASTTDGGLDSDGNAAKLRRSGEQYLIGVDGSAGSLRFGVAGAYAHLQHAVAARASDQRSNNFTVSAYTGIRRGAWSLATTMGYSWSDVTTHRSVALAGLTQTDTANYTAHAFRAAAELDVTLPTSSTVDVMPFAGIDYIRANTGRIVERGGLSALGGSADIATAFTSVGLRGGATLPVIGRAAIRLRGSGSWQHAIGDTRAEGRLGLISGPIARVDSVPLAADEFVTSASAEVQFGHATLGIGYDGRAAETAHDNRVSARLAVRF